MNAILALDADTTNVRAILVGRQANILAPSSVPLAIIVFARLLRLD
jgi:glycerol kinase